MSKGNALSDDLPDSEIEAARVIEVSAVIEAKHLFVKVTVKMKRLDRYIGSRNTALEKRPEILKAIRVNAAIHI